MSTPHARQLFLNLPVRDPARSEAFFAALGFAFEPRFASPDSVCMTIGPGCFVMMLAEARWQTFTKQSICDTRTHSEALFSVSCESREAVDAIVQKAIAGGGGTDDAAQDHGFMYDWSFYDLDGHRWGVFWMDPSAAQ